jgi:hypothetical protein
MEFLRRSADPQLARACRPIRGHGLNYVDSNTLLTGASLRSSTCFHDRYALHGASEGVTSRIKPLRNSADQLPKRRSCDVPRYRVIGNSSFAEHHEPSSFADGSSRAIVNRDASVVATYACLYMVSCNLGLHNGHYAQFATAMREAESEPVSPHKPIRMKAHGISHTV